MIIIIIIIIILYNFWECEEAKNNQQCFNVNRDSSLLQHSQLQQAFYTETLKNSSASNVASFDIDTL